MRISTQFTSQQGLPDQGLLHERGPILPVKLTRRRGKGKAKEGLALVDTGASVTGIDKQAALDIGLPIVASGTVSSTTHANEIVPCFVAEVEFLHPRGLAGGPKINSNKAFGLNLSSLGLLAIIGRDVLRLCRFTYDGPAASFALELLPQAGQSPVKSD